MSAQELPPKDLSEPPADPAAANNYKELYRLWNLLNTRLDQGQDLTREEFHDWANTVITHLDNEENKRFLKPLRPHIPVDAATIQHARAYHLHKICALDKDGKN